MDEHSDGDIAEQLFNDAVREYVVRLKVSHLFRNHTFISARNKR